MSNFDPAPGRIINKAPELLRWAPGTTVNFLTEGGAEYDVKRYIDNGYYELTGKDGVVRNAHSNCITPTATIPGGTTIKRKEDGLEYRIVGRNSNGTYKLTKGTETIDVPSSGIENSESNRK